MRRPHTISRLFTITSAISLLLFVTTDVFWVRSYWRQEIFSWNRLEQRFDPPPQHDGYMQTSLYWYSKITAQGTKGCFAISVEQWPEAEELPRWEHFAVPNPAGFRAGSGSWWARLGFTHTTSPSPTDPDPFPSAAVTAPCWAVAAIFAVLPTIWAFLLLRDRSRRRAGCCRVCGYDLRASPDRCPECGTAAYNAMS